MNNIINKFFVSSKNNLYNYNCKFIDRIEIIMHNPNTIRDGSIFKNKLFSGTIWFEKDKMRLYKTFEDNKIDNLYKSMSEFVDKEIKI
jgi:hypothetical protein